jgi:sulfite exporter TauE/SafE
MDSCCHPLAEQGAASVDFLLVFLTGLTMSLGHCLGMCGPIQAAYCLEQERQGHRGFRLTLPLLRYHLGRIAGYAMIGAFFGLLGSATLLTGATRTFQGWLALVAAFLMIAFVLGLWGAGRFGSALDAFGIGDRVAARVRRFLTAPSGVGQLQLGVANGFLPCGPVIAVAITAAAAAHVLIGMGLMAVYGLGTLPVLFVMGLVSGRLGPRVRQRLSRIGTALIVALAVQLALRGLATLGVLPHLRFGDVVIW